MCLPCNDEHARKDKRLVVDLGDHQKTVNF